MSEAEQQRTERSTVRPSTVLDPSRATGFSGGSLMRRLTHSAFSGTGSIFSVKLKGETGQFGGNALSCAPGTITVFDESNAPARTPYDFEIRSGNELLHPSEVYSIGEGELTILGDSPEEMLRRVGTSPGEVAELLNTIGMSARAQIPMSALSRGEVRKLMLLNALSAKVDLVHFDNPFANLPKDAAESLATALAGVAAKRGTVLLVTGVRNVPENWRSEAAVKIKGAPAESKEKKGNALSRRVHGEIDRVRRLLSSVPREASLHEQQLKTSPQIVLGPPDRKERREELAVENIPNPQLTEEEQKLSVRVDRNGNGQENGAAVSAGANGNPKKKKRKRKSTLTDVNVVYGALYRAGVVSAIQDIRTNLRDANASEQASQMPPPRSPDKKVLAAKIKRRQNRLLAILAFLIVAMAVMEWMHITG